MDKNKKKIRTFFRIFWKQTTICLTVLTLVFIVIDYFIKWRILSFFKNIIPIVWLIIISDFINIFFFIWLFLLTIFLLKRNKKEFKTEEIKKELLEIIRNEFSAKRKSLLDNFRKQVSSINSAIKLMDDKIDNLEIFVKELKMIKYTKEDKQGAITIPIDLLGKAIERKRDSEISRNLIRIRDYVENTPIRSYVDANLEKKICLLEGSTFGAQSKTLIEEIRKLKKAVVD